MDHGNEDTDWVHVVTPDDDDAIRVLVSHSKIPSTDPGNFEYTAICTLEVKEKVEMQKNLYVDCLVDKSYSMGNNLELAKTAVKTMIRHMNKRSDRLQIHLRVSGFATDITTHTLGYVKVTDETVDALRLAVDEIDDQDGDGTNISLALEDAMVSMSEAITSTSGSQGYVIVLTDGRPNRGEGCANRIHTEVHRHAKGAINVGAIALGDAPERDFMNELTKGGRFFYASTGQDLPSAYEEVEGGLRDVVRHCKIHCTFGDKFGSGSARDTISLPIDLNYAQLMTLPLRNGVRILEFYIENEGVVVKKAVEIPVGDAGEEADLPPEIVAHRELVQANINIEMAIQSAAQDGPEAAIGRLVEVTNAVNVIAHNTPAMAMRSAHVRHAVRRATSQLQSFGPTDEPSARNVRARLAIPSLTDDDDEVSGFPVYRSITSASSSTLPPAQASLDLICAEASSQVSSF